MVAEPALVEVANPTELIVAVFVAEDVQVTEVVRLAVVPLE
jgi:hypothetical protein